MILNDVAAEGSSPYRLKRGTKASVRGSCGLYLTQLV